MKKVISVALILVLIGACGCSLSKSNDQKNSMLEYASAKYGKDFTVKNFQFARDETYTNILSLSDGDVIFNVSQKESFECGDDYPQKVFSKKMSDKLFSEVSSNVQIYADFLVNSGNEMTIDYVMNNEPKNILLEKGLLGANLFIITNKDFSSEKELLFDIYESVIELNPKYIDLQIIKAETISEELFNMMHDIPNNNGYELNKYPEVLDSLRITKTSINNADELIGIK